MLERSVTVDGGPRFVFRCLGVSSWLSRGLLLAGSANDGFVCWRQYGAFLVLSGSGIVCGFDIGV